MTLWSLKRNQTASIQSFDKSIDASYVERLKDFGLLEGEKIRCLRRSFLSGPRVYFIGASLIALEKDIALQITVKEEEE